MKVIVLDLINLNCCLYMNNIVKPYSDGDLGQYCFRQWLVSRRHQATALTDGDLPLLTSSCIHSGHLVSHFKMTSSIQDCQKALIPSTTLTILSLKCTKQYAYWWPSTVRTKIPPGTEWQKVTYIYRTSTEVKSCYVLMGSIEILPDGKFRFQHPNG